MKVMTRDCGCIYLADSTENLGSLVYYCGYEHFESPWGFGNIKELPEGEYTEASTTGQENVIKQISQRMADGEKFRELKQLLNIKE